MNDDAFQLKPKKNYQKLSTDLLNTTDKLCTKLFILERLVLNLLYLNINLSERRVIGEANAFPTSPVLSLDIVEPVRFHEGLGVRYPEGAGSCRRFHVT